MNQNETLTAPIKGAVRQEVAGMQIDIVQAGRARVRRIIYPAGFNWARDMKGVVPTRLCMHAHVGFLVQGEMTFRFPDGATETFTAPQVVAVEPGHDGWISDEGPAIMIEFDFLHETVEMMGLPQKHSHSDTEPVVNS